MGPILIGESDQLGGEVHAPPSKSYTHRTVIAASLSKGTSKISNPLTSDDTQATLRAVKAFGAEVELHKNQWIIQGKGTVTPASNPVHCKESGSTLRFMIPVAALSRNPSTFLLGSSLATRPLTPLLTSLKHLGTESSLNLNTAPPSVKIYGGGIRGGKTTIRGDVSSQFISGLLFACPKAKRTTDIQITTHLESKNYVQMTLQVISKHGINVSTSSDLTHMKIPPNQIYEPVDHEVPGDFSSAAFILAAAAITSSKIKVEGLNPNSLQADRAILGILSRMGSKVKVGHREVEVQGAPLQALQLDASNIPDMVPVTSVLACYSQGVSKIYNAERLRYKESDRLTSLYLELQKMGAEITMKEDSLIIKGPCNLQGAVIDPHNDHRIAMACAIAALGAKGKTEILNSECVRKSYPLFFDDLYSLGANIIGK
ncbi:MAG: 3-phosphoshikimate 1-carboxyvinyltransferase [Thermoproteota archaeon]